MELMTRKKAAPYLRPSVRKLDLLAAKGELRRVKLGEGKRARVLFRCRDLDAFVEANLSADSSEIEREAAEILRAVGE